MHQSRESSKPPSAIALWQVASFEPSFAYDRGGDVLPPQSGHRLIQLFQHRALSSMRFNLTTFGEKSIMYRRKSGRSIR
jgi:hypothetical protein